jgi:alanine dehydrogenase
MTFIIGIPKEIKTNEFRVSLIPNDVKKFVDMNIPVFVEKNAGIGALFTNEEYINSGAIICETAKEIYEKSNIIIKVKELLETEYDFINDNHIILTFFHFASIPSLISAMINKKPICIAYETIKKDDGTYPILAPMSIIAGEQSIINANGFITNMRGEYRDYRDDVVTIIGVGNVGRASAYKAKEMGYRTINLMDKDLGKMNEFIGKDGFYIYEMTNMTLIELLKVSTIVIGSIYNSGEKAKKIITDEMLDLMMDKSIIMDVAIDQGGITEQSKIRPVYDPIIKYNKTNIYCVSNIPSIVPRRASMELSNAVYPYIEEIIRDMDIEKTIENNEEIKRGVNIFKGDIWNLNLMN